MNANRSLIPNFWEGVVAVDFTLEQVRQRSYALSQLLQADQQTCLVAYDTRFMSNLVAQDIYQMLRQQLNTHLVADAAPLPALRMALEQGHVHTALVVSARNRPYWYNGLVLLERRVSRLSLDPATTPAPQNLLQGPFPLSTEGSAGGAPFVADQLLQVRQPYIRWLTNLIDMSSIRRSIMTIFVDPMHGTTAGYLPAAIGEGTQTKAIEINRETDPLFGKTTPLPITANLSRLRKLVRESDSHIGLACSADGTALSVIDKNGELLDLCEMTLLLASYLYQQHHMKGMVITPSPAPTSPLANVTTNLSNWRDQLGFKVELSDDSTGRITSLLQQNPNELLVGCTDQGEVIVGGYSSYPDALLSGLLFVEMIARNNGNLRTVINELRTNLGV